MSERPGQYEFATLVQIHQHDPVFVFDRARFNRGNMQTNVKGNPEAEQFLQEYSDLYEQVMNFKKKYHDMYSVELEENRIRL